MDDHESGIGHSVTLSTVGFGIHPNNGVFRNLQIVIDDTVADAAVRAHLHAGKQQRGIDRRLTVHSHTR